MTPTNPTRASTDVVGGGLEQMASSDALGGRFDVNDPRACGYDKALCDALKEIEKLGGKWS